MNEPTEAQKMVCGHPTFQECNYTSPQDCYYFNICQMIAYHRVACNCPKWLQDEGDIDYDVFMKLAKKSFPNCPFCGELLERFNDVSNKTYFTPGGYGHGGR